MTEAERKELDRIVDYFRGLITTTRINETRDAEAIKRLNAKPVKSLPGHYMVTQGRQKGDLLRDGNYYEQQRRRLLRNIAANRRLYERKGL